jgi:anti-anti-sigma regulatory factor
MDSSGVGAYVHAFRRARARNVPLTIGERSPAVDRVLVLSGVEDALKAEGGGESSTR